MRARGLRTEDLLLAGGNAVGVPLVAVEPLCAANTRRRPTQDAVGAR